MSHSTSRDAILGRIRHSLGRPAQTPDTPPDTPDAVTDRLKNPVANLIPARAQLPHAQQIDLFIKMATQVSATVARVGSPDDIPREVARYLADQNLPARVRIAPDAGISGLAWDQTMLDISAGIAGPEDAVSVTPSFAAVAETGTVMVQSGPDHPYTLNLLPDTHIVVVRASMVSGCYEDVWARLRQSEGHGNMPRTFLWVTGPSRTGDIEQTIQLGAHGPRRLHIVLVDDT